jgi:type I restriction enzyme, S subunit
MGRLKRKTLGEFLSLQRGYDLTSDERIAGNIPVMGAAGQNGFHNKSLASAPGVIVGRSGGSFGQIHLANEDYWPHNTALFVSDFKGNDPYFTYYLLKNINFSQFNSGSAQPSLNRNYVYPININVPLPQEQKKISAVLSALDAKIALNNRINAELESMAKTLYDYWFVQFDYPNDTAKPYKSSGGKMVWNEELKREIPEEWEVGSLVDLANITMGQSPPGESYNEIGDGIIFFQGCTDFGKRFPTVRQYTTQPSRFAKTGDILLSVRAPVGTMNISNAHCCIGRGLAALNSKTGSISYLYGVMSDFKQVFDRRNTVGTTFGSITKDDLFSLKVIKPSLTILEKFQSALSPIFDQLNLLEQENQHLSSLRDWLLPMLMNGQVTVG